MTIGADDLRKKYGGDTIAIAEAWLRGHLVGYWERFAEECCTRVHIEAAKARMELRQRGLDVPPAPTASER